MVLVSSLLFFLFGSERQIKLAICQLYGARGDVNIVHRILSYCAVSASSVYTVLTRSVPKEYCVQTVLIMENSYLTIMYTYVIVLDKSMLVI